VADLAIVSLTITKLLFLSLLLLSVAQKKENRSMLLQSCTTLLITQNTRVVALHVVSPKA
jgi:hypothetical protein